MFSTVRGEMFRRSQRLALSSNSPTCAARIGIWATVEAPVVCVLVIRSSRVIEFLCIGTTWVDALQNSQLSSAKGRRLLFVGGAFVSLNK